MTRTNLRAFISYSTKDKHVAAEVKDAFERLGVSSFLAHDDIRVSEEWKERIIQELGTCDIFVPLLSKNFRASNWASQEIGFAVSRQGILIIPLSLDGEVPFGFVSHIQGKTVVAGSIDSQLFDSVLLDRFPRTIIPYLIEKVANAGSFRGAEAVLKPLVPLFGQLTKQEANQLAQAAVANNQVWSAGLCRAEYLPAFLRAQRKAIEPATLRALEYQIANDEPYPGR